MATETAAPMLNIGPNTETIIAARQAIMDMIHAQVGDSVKEKALDAFVQVTQVRNVEIRDNTFYGDGGPAAVEVR